MKFGALIKNLAVKAKVDVADPKYKDLLDNATEVPDELATSIENNLFDEEVGKSNANLSKHFKAQYLNGVDAQVMAIADEEGLDDASKAEILAEKSSSKKITLLKAKIKDVLTAKHAATGDNKGLKDEIARLNGDMVILRDTQKKELEKVRAESDNSVTEFAMTSHLTSVPYANAEVPLETNVELLRILTNKELAAKKAKIVRDGTFLKLKNAENPELDYLENNKSVAFNEFIDSVAAKNKLLKVNGASPAKPDPQRKPITQPDKGKPNVTGVANSLRARADALRTE